MQNQPWGRARLTEVNPHLVCVLCHGYFIDATTMAECPHSFCRSCILLYLETKSYCPICEVQIHKTKPHLNLKPDKTLQDIVYKLVPGLFHNEMCRRREFYTKYPNRDLYLSPEARGVGVERIIYSPEDNISLSLEYYDEQEEVEPAAKILHNSETFTNRSEREREEWASTRPGASADILTHQQKPATTDGLKRYLQCPAVITMSHLKKFIRLKYGLTQACTVEILYRRESLPDSYSLMDIAYIYTWKRNGPMRFYYRIHVPTPLKTSLPPLKASSEEIRDPVPASQTKLQSPELLDAVGLRPKAPEAPAPIPVVEKSEETKEEKKPEEKEEEKVEERPKISPAEDTAVSQLLALSNGLGAAKQSEQSALESKPSSVAVEKQQPPPATPPAVKPSPANGNVFKVPQSLTKRFVFNGGKLVAVKSKQSGGRGGKGSGEKTKLNGKLNGETPLTDRFSNPLGLVGNGPLGVQGGKLPPGSPRPPPNSEKVLKTKYMPPSGSLLNRLTPEVTLTQNKTAIETFPKHAPSQIPSSQPKPPQGKPGGSIKSPVTTNGQPPHRKEVNRLEQIVQNCLKKESSQKSAKEAEVRSDAAKTSGPLSGNANTESGARADRGDSSIPPADHVASDPSETDRVDTAPQKGSESILKRKLNDPPNRRPPQTYSPDPQNGLADAKKRRLVTPDVSIELMANPAKEKQKEKKREPSDLSELTKRFLNDIQRMKKIDSETLKINKLDQMCASTVKIEKVVAPPPVRLVSTPESSPSGGEKKSAEGGEFSENDQLFIDIRNKCEALKRKNSEPASVAIERVSEDPTAKPASQQSPTKSETLTVSSSEAPPKPSGTHKKLPRLIEINAPPRPKLPPLIPDPKQKTGLKMTTVRKEVPIGKEVPVSLVRRDCNGALDLSSGMSPPNGTSKTGNKSPFHRPPTGDKSPTASSLSPLMAMTSFPMPDTNRSSPIRIPTLKPKTSPTPRPSSLSSSSPSPPAEPRSAAEVFPTAAYQQLFRQQMEFQNRILASQVNNNWGSKDLSAKKFEDWMRNVMGFPHHHPLMFPPQLSPESGRK